MPMSRNTQIWRLRTSLEEVHFSGIGAMVTRANARGGDLIRLEIGDVDYEPPTEIRDGITYCLEKGLTHYPPFAGEIALRETIAEKLQKENGIKCLPDDLLVTVGGSLGLFCVIYAIVEPGDEVLIPTPIWPHLASMVQLCGAVPVLVAMSPEDDFRLDTNRLRMSLSKRTRAIIVNSPNNPCGTMLTKEELQRLVLLAGEHDLTIISDEEYEQFVFSEVKHISPASLYDRTITIQSFSKTLAMSGFRLGYVVAQREIIDAVGKVHLFTGMYAPSIAQHAVLSAMPRRKDFIRQMVADYRERMHCLVDGLNTISGINCRYSEGSVYVWPDCRACGISSEELAYRLLDRVGVVTVPGSVFGSSGEGFLRLSLAAPIPRLLEAVERIRYALTG